MEESTIALAADAAFKAAELQETNDKLRKTIERLRDELEMAKADLRHVTDVVESMAQNTNFLDDYWLQKFGEALDLSLTREMSVSVTIEATATIHIPYGKTLDEFDIDPEVTGVLSYNMPHPSLGGQRLDAELEYTNVEVEEY